MPREGHLIERVEDEHARLVDVARREVGTREGDDLANLRVIKRDGEVRVRGGGGEGQGRVR